MFATAMVTLITLALYPNLDLPRLSFFGRHSDILYHSSGFWVLSTIAMAATGRRASVVLGMIALAVLLEILQTVVPGRSPTMSDLFASLAGIAFSAISVAIAQLCGGRRNKVALNRLTITPWKSPSKDVSKTSLASSAKS